MIPPDRPIPSPDCENRCVPLAKLKKHVQMPSSYILIQLCVLFVSFACHLAMVRGAQQHPLRLRHAFWAPFLACRVVFTHTLCVSFVCRGMTFSKVLQQNSDHPDFVTQGSFVFSLQQCLIFGVGIWDVPLIGYKD